MLYLKIRKKILDYFPFIRIIKKYNIIIPKILSHIIWPIFKPKKILYDNRVFYTSPNIYSNPSRDLFAYNKFYNNYEIKIIKKYVREGHNCMDVGANIGFFTYIFLKQINNKGKVYSFENIPKVFEILKKNFENDDNVICYEGEVGINSSNLIVDNLIGDRIDFIKIDIDGLDYCALKSCEKIIKNNKPKIIIELSEASEREHGIHYNKTIEFLENNNYNLYLIDINLEKFNRKLEFNEVVNILGIHSTQGL